MIITRSGIGTFLPLAGGTMTGDINMNSQRLVTLLNILFDIAGVLQARNVDDNFFVMQARDTGVGLAEVARITGAADPYFQATLPMRLLPVAVPGAVVEGHFGYDSAIDRLWYRDAALTRVIPQITSGTYIGNGGVNTAIAHGLGAIPRLVVINCIDSVSLEWFRIIATAVIYCNEVGGNFALAETIPDAVNFYVGNAGSFPRSANNNLDNYGWVAFG